jgi:DNA-3-methyladenine glycosylase II
VPQKPLRKSKAADCADFGLAGRARRAKIAAMVGRIIEGDGCVAEGAAWLAAREPRFAVALEQTGPLPLRRRADGFAALLDAIVSQQVSVASANAIWARLDAAGLTDQAAMSVADDDALRAVGLSRQKMRYARALAQADLDFTALRVAPTDNVIATLVALPGIGTWTAEIYAMFSLGRADVFAPGDLALQEAARDLFSLEARPSEKALRAMAEQWSPWRSVAARLLWSYYRIAKAREGVR